MVLVKNDDMTDIQISIDQNMVSSFFYFLERGVRKEILIGLDMRTILSDQLNISEGYIDNRIKTLFLNGSPVGDINSTIVTNGATIAISAAMPGLAGATFRRVENTDASLEAFNNNVETRQKNQEKGIVTIKLFNLVLRELGPAFLKSGILISKEELIKFVFLQPEKFLKVCEPVKINGHTTNMEAISQVDDSKLIRLQIMYINKKNMFNLI